MVVAVHTTIPRLTTVAARSVHAVLARLVPAAEGTHRGLHDARRLLPCAVPFRPLTFFLRPRLAPLRTATFAFLGGSARRLISSAHLVCSSRLLSSSGPLMSSVQLVCSARRFISFVHLVCEAHLLILSAHFVCSYPLLMSFAQLVCSSPPVISLAQLV